MREVLRRVATVELIGLVREHEAHWQPPPDAQQRLEEAARGGIRPVQVLQDEQHHAVAREALEGTQHRLLDAAAHLLRGVQARRGAIDGQVVQPGRVRAQQQPQVVPGTPDDMPHAIVGERREGGRQCRTQRLVGLTGARLECRATGHDHLRQAAQPLGQLVEQARDADAGRSREHDAAVPPLGSALEHGRETRQVALSPHERHGPKDSRLGT